MKKTSRKVTKKTTKKAIDLETVLAGKIPDENVLVVTGRTSYKNAPRNNPPRKGSDRITEMRIPTQAEIDKAKREIEEEDDLKKPTPGNKAIFLENARRSGLPPEHPEHLCGLMCDGQDGWNSYCARIRMKLFGRRS